MLKVIKFSAVWCPPCQLLNPIVHKISRDYDDVEFEFVDIDNDPDLAIKFKIASVPTLVFLVDGKEEERLVGAYPEQMIRNVIEKLI